MGYNKEIYHKAYDAIRNYKIKAESDAEYRRESFYKKVPQAEVLEHEISKTALSAAKAVLSGGNNTKAALEQLKTANQKLQEKLNTLLINNHLPLDYFEPHYHCEKCKDTGYIDGNICSCLKNQIINEYCKILNANSPMSTCTFESFKTEYYPDEYDESIQNTSKAHMEKVFHFCKSYADNFTLQSRNLLFVGGTGLSKTHLSLSIANVVVQKGFSVVYDSVQNLVSKLENEHFRNSSEQSGTEDIIYGCDLLILDDLGTEFKSPFVIASLYNLVNTRILTKKPTIISTNLTPEEIEQFYSIRFLSRISGNYVRMPFSGKDIRVLKALKRNNN